MKEEIREKSEKVFSISEYLDILNEGFKVYRAKIVGETSDVNFSSAGHVYFHLKDDKDQSALKCVIYKSRYNLYGIELKDGLKIISFGNPNIHKQYGFSFIAETIEYAGEGVLKKEYEKLKKKLMEEGLFAKERKRPIPAYPQRIGIITSRQGAVLADFLNNIGKFGFIIKMIDSRVEGQTATKDLLSSIRVFRQKEIDVLVIIRGGGSLEQLLPFNNESLVREVVKFPVPVIAGIGHDKDEPLVALAADAAESTPTAVANLLNQSWQEALLLLEKYERGILGSFEGIFEKYGDIEHSLKISLRNFQNALLNVKINLRNSANKSFAGFRSVLSRIKQQMEYVEKTINFNNPERQLTLGYSIARRNGRIVRTVKNIGIGDNLDIQVADGEINSEVKNIRPIK